MCSDLGEPRRGAGRSADAFDAAACGFFGFGCWASTRLIQEV
jgi:hypothetical protein